jgi:hypothetical protein
MGRKKDTFLVKTYRKGFKVIDIKNNPEYKEICALTKAQLRTMFQGAECTFRPENFHTTDMLLKNSDNNEFLDGIVTHEVPETWEGEDNTEGYIELEDEAAVVLILNALSRSGDTRVGLDLRFGKDISSASKKLLRPTHVGDSQNLKTKMKVSG